MPASAPDRPAAPPTLADCDPEWLEAQVERERHPAHALSEIREAVFGA